MNGSEGRQHCFDLFSLVSLFPQPSMCILVLAFFPSL
jgi:hypothetical protein